MVFGLALHIATAVNYIWTLACSPTVRLPYRIDVMIYGYMESIHNFLAKSGDVSTVVKWLQSHDFKSYSMP